MGFGICAIAPCPKPVHANAKSIVETSRLTSRLTGRCTGRITGLMRRETRPGKPVGRTAETASPDAVRPLEDESTGAAGKADERREVGNVIASVVVKETGKVLKYSFFNPEILSPRAGALRHLWQNAPLHQPGKRVRAA